jgi:hypothetical protein
MATAGAMSTAVSPCGLQSISLTRKVRQKRSCVLSRGGEWRFGGGIRRGSSVKREILDASLKKLVARDVVRGAAEAPKVEEVAPEQLVERTENRPSKIWMSDVVVRKRRNYFKNRQWTAKDLTYAGFMALMHGLCVCAPATFSWNAFLVFVELYVITGMLGITLSYHRNLSHKSFKVPKWLEYTFAYCGVQAIQVTLRTTFLPGIIEVKVVK